MLYGVDRSRLGDSVQGPTDRVGEGGSGESECQGGIGRIARHGAQYRAAASDETSIPSRSCRAAAASGPSAWRKVDAAPPVNSSTNPSAETTSGLSNAQVPARSPS